MTREEYMKIVDDFNARGEYFEGEHSLLNFAAKYYPEQLDEFYDEVTQIAEGNNQCILS